MELKPKLEARKEQLMSLKTKSPKAFTDSLRTELDNLIVTLAEVDEIIENAEATEVKPKEVPAPVAEEAKEATEYEVKKGTEQMVHASICKGRRFNPNTGERESKPYVQMFTLGEWQLFQQFHKAQGYHIEKVLYNPFEK